MKENIIRNFYPENNDEELNIGLLRKRISKIEGCFFAHVVGEGDNHHIEAGFWIPFKVEKV